MFELVFSLRSAMKINKKDNFQLSGGGKSLANVSSKLLLCSG
jgi:hypothetical protein